MTMTDECRTILITDDEDGIRALLKQKLSRAGYSCLEAKNATEAMETLASYCVGLVILDMKMPGKTGLELLPEIKKLYPDTPVIIATAVTEVDVVIECMKLGAYDYLTKPFDLTAVNVSVSRAFEKRRLELELKDYHENLQQKVTEQAEMIRDSFINSITSLAFALDAKDGYTNGHSQRVSGVSTILGRELKLSSEQVHKIRIAGLIHDIGKIGIPEKILNKPGRLDKEEFLRVQTHCTIGERILEPVVNDVDILQMVRHHHERYDGKGYPDGLVGNDIPIGARILCVADSYDAMTSDRPYRHSIEARLVFEELQQNRLTQFDPEIVDTFVRLLSVNETTHRPLTV
jgi:putative two-component system response regulator